MFPGNVANQWGGYRYQTGAGFPIAVFPDPVSGAAANLQLLTSSPYLGSSLHDVIARWSGGSPAQVREYLNAVSSATGLPGNAPITNANALAVMQAMSHYEGGGRYVTPEEWQQAFDLVNQNSNRTASTDPYQQFMSGLPDVQFSGDYSDIIPGLQLAPESSPFSGQPTGTQSQLPDEPMPSVQFPTYENTFSPDTSYTPYQYNFSPSPVETGFYDFGGSGPSNPAPYEAPYSVPENYSNYSPDYSSNYGTQSDTGLSDFGDYNWTPPPQNGFDTGIDWGNSLPSGQGITDRNYWVDPASGDTHIYDADWNWLGQSGGQSETPAQEPNSATYQFADTLPTVGPATDYHLEDSPLVGDATDSGLGQIVSGYGPTNPSPYTGFSGFSPYVGAGGSPFGWGGSITGFGHDAGGGSYTNFSLGRGFSGPGGFVSPVSGHGSSMFDMPGLMSLIRGDSEGLVSPQDLIWA